MEQRVKIGLVGASWFSDLWYLPNLATHPAVELAAICSESGESAKRMAEKYGIASVYQSYEVMLEEAALDGVCIVTPNDLHAPIAEAAARKGIHVICEKPLAMSAEEAQRMLQAAEESGIIHSVNFTYREHPGIQYIRALLEEGRIGDIRSAEFEYSGDYGLQGPPGWRGISARGGIGGVLADLGSHIIDLAQYVLTDAITEVCADVQFIHTATHADAAADSVRFLSRFGKGAQAVIYTSWIDHQGRKGQTIGIKLTGTKGSLHFHADEFGTVLELFRAGEPAVKLDIPGMSKDDGDEPSEYNFRPWRLTDKNEVYKWVDQIQARKAGKTPAVSVPTFADGRQVQAVMDAVMQSAAERSWISIG